MRARLLAAGVMAAALVAAGCSDQTQQKAREAGQGVTDAARAAGGAVQSAADDAVRNVERAHDAAAGTAEAAKQQRDAAKASLERAGDRASEAVKDAAHAGSAAVQTAEVKTALIADSRVDAAGINVDTDDQAKTVTLRGHVPSAAQKLAAGQIAHDKAEGYEVRNDLVVRP